MCSTSPKENREVDIHGMGYLDEVSSNLNCRNCCCTNFRKEKETKIAIQEEDGLSASNYLDQQIFGLLIPALEETLIEASKQNVLRVQKRRFNGLDYIAEILWNRNPRRSKTFSRPLNVFDIPPFKQYLHLHPRPYYPKSWLWSEDEAALHIQRYVRGWLVRKRADVQEMRQFWKVIGTETFFGKKKSCTVQYQRLSGKTQDDTKHEIIDEDLVRCEKYRSMIYTNPTTRKLKGKNTYYIKDYIEK